MSDLHLVVSHPPVLRLHGELQTLDVAPLEKQAVHDLLVPLCPAHALARFRIEKNVDFAFELPAAAGSFRFRANYFLCAQQMGACFRVIPSEIPDFQWAGFPESLAERLAHYRNGLVLFCGVAGSGKTTSLAMIVNLLNREGGYRIITVEEPIEYSLPADASLGGHAAGGRTGCAHVCGRTEVRPAPGPGCDPGGRDPGSKTRHRWH